MYSAYTWKLVIGPYGGPCVIMLFVKKGVPRILIIK